MKNKLDKLCGNLIILIIHILEILLLVLKMGLLNCGKYRREIMGNFNKK
jgi:hypothetical protein